MQISFKHALSQTMHGWHAFCTYYLISFLISSIHNKGIFLVFMQVLVQEYIMMCRITDPTLSFISTLQKYYFYQHCYYFLKNKFITNIYMVYIHIIFFHVCENLSIIKNIVDSFNLHNVNLLNEQIYEESNFFYSYKLSWKIIEIHLSTLTLNDKEIHFDDKDKLSGNNHLLKNSVDEFLYMPSLDQNFYFYVNNRDNV